MLSPPGRSPTRPITGIAKKSLFDTLGARVAEATVVDLYCGTGTLGLEALSRGARRCFFAERDRGALVRLRRNIEALGAGERCVVWRGDVTAGLRARLVGVDDAVDIAFVDPPYADARRWSWEAASQAIFDPLCERLSAEGLVVLRLAGKVHLPDPVGALCIRRRKDYGDMALVFLGAGE